MKVGRNNLNRKIFALKDFRGVDYASSPLEVKPYRATDMANLLLRDGMLHKRKGFRQVLLEHPLVDEGKTFDEQFEVKVFPWDQNYMMVQYLNTDYRKGSYFYIYAKGPYSKDWGVEGTYHYPDATSLGQGVRVGAEMYIFCGGEYLTYTGTLMSRITEEVAYIPTTTINIPASVVTYSEEDSSKYTIMIDREVAYPNQSNESINMLTGLRKNKCMVKASLDYGRGYIYFQLDGNPIDYEYHDEADWQRLFYWRKPTLKINNEFFIDFDVIDDDPLLPAMGRVWGNEKYGIAVCLRSDFLPGFFDPSAQEQIWCLAIYSKSRFEDLLSLCTTDANGYIQLELTYYDRESEKNSKKIKSCTCATLFGVDGANDRLFVGGGINGNMVYFSENDIDLKPNPTYFPADQFLVCGMDGAKVNGFMRVSNGTLAIFKDVENYGDVSVYYTSGYYTDVGTGEEGNTYKQARFTVQAGDIARSGVSAKAVNNFEGDNIFVSKEGVFGIQLSSNVASGERYARERSRTINPKITKLGLRNAKSIVYDEKYFLAVNNGEVYVADSRYKFTLKGDQENTFNYEWFRLTGIFVKEWFILNDTLCFIDKDGYLCEFTESFADQYMVTTDNNELTVNTETVTFNEERLELVKASSYAIDQEGRTWQLQLTEDEKSIVIPEDIDIAENADLTLWFYVPIPAYWQSAVLSLDNPMYRKNMWALSMTAEAEHGGMINLGYKTRLNAVNNIEIEGVNKGGYEDISFLGGLRTFLISGKESAFGMYTFDVGGYVGINTYRRRLFERNFVHIQLLFTSETTTDCAVSEVDIEYSISRKNIGVG